MFHFSTGHLVIKVDLRRAYGVVVPEGSTKGHTVTLMIVTLDFLIGDRTEHVGDPEELETRKITK